MSEQRDEYASRMALEVRLAVDGLSGHNNTGYAVVMLLSEESQLRFDELREELDVHSQTLTNTLDDLQHGGLVKKRAGEQIGDQSTGAYELSNFGDRLLNALHKSVQSVNERLQPSQNNDTGGRTDYLRVSELFKTTENGQCRVCGRNVRPPLRKYCSYWCQHVAKAVSSLYEWSRIRRWVLDRDESTCVRCGWRAGDGGRQLEVDHIIPQNEGGHPFDPRNLQTLCSKCHSAKEPGEDFRDDADRDTGVEAREFRSQTLDSFISGGWF